MLLIYLFFFIMRQYQKFQYNKNKCVSTTKIINESNTLINLKRIFDFKGNTENTEYILGENCFNKGDSGSYMELA